MTSQTESVRKKSLFKRWWIWPLIATGVILIISILVLSKPEPLELTTLSGKDKQDVISMLGKPDDSWILRDDEDGYYYVYPFGVTLLGNEKVVSEISLTEGSSKGAVKNEYAILGFMLGSEFDQSTEQQSGMLRKPNLDVISPDGNRSRLYHDVKEDVIFNVLTVADRIIGLRYVRYANSDESYSLDLANYIGNIVPEQQLTKELDITSKITDNIDNTYYFGQASMMNWIKSDVKNGQIQEIMITDGRFFNISGQRIGDTAEQTTTALGTPLSAEVEEGYMVETFELSDANMTNNYIVKIRSSEGKIISIKATLQATPDDSFLSFVEEEQAPLVSATLTNTPTDIWLSLDLEQQIELNQYFSEFSSVNFGASPYIRDSAISSYSKDELIRFAIERNQRFGQDNSYSFNPDNDEELMMHQDLVAEVIEYYFGIQIMHKSISDYKYKDDFYRWDAYRWAYMDTNLFSQVQRLLDNQDGTLTAEIGVFQDLNDYGYFNNEDPEHLQAKSIRYQPQATWTDDLNFHYIGTVNATIKPSESNEWILIDYQVETMY